ncbi:fibroblast growth factor receptor 2 [Elysia marginata]|uniref:Fibroblast growth factor receptor 2 n=1 Tax=Elysia marginata TaxID=1093978 RepID=A0AAV4GHF9_9GAST|nr:fibroblast growth factor receptor 2 [Elysia marginata]
MAPESLYGQVYTTKSDIWSYGIVLWETVTLGASPYPGIPPERLFPLLSTGYRMDKPDECPDELYAIMQKCWKSEPEQRPTFAELVRFLDNILQQNTDYLDLSGENYIEHSSGFDFEGKDFLMSLESDTDKEQKLTSSSPRDYKNQPKPSSIDDKTLGYRNLQPLNSDLTYPELSVTPIIEDIVKVKHDMSSCHQEENEEGSNESEVETESSQLLTPDLDDKTKGQGFILSSDSFGSSLKAPTCGQDETQSRYKIDPTARPRVHENLTYV